MSQADSWAVWWAENIDIFVEKLDFYNAFSDVEDLLTRIPYDGATPEERIIKFITEQENAYKTAALQGLVDYAESVNILNKNQVLFILRLGLGISGDDIGSYNFINSGFISRVFFDPEYGICKDYASDDVARDIYGFGFNNIRALAYSVGNLSSAFNHKADVIDLCEKMIEQPNFDVRYSPSVFMAMVAADPDSIYQYWCDVRPHADKLDLEDKAPMLGIAIARLIKQNGYKQLKSQIDMFSYQTHADKWLLSSVAYGLEHNLK